MVDINVSRNFAAEDRAIQRHNTLQEEIFSTFGINSPSPPVLRCRNATQTSIVLEWDPINLATADLRSLSLYRNGNKAGAIPRDKLTTKISGLAVDTEYTFHLVLRTSAGTYTSEKLTIRTQRMTDLTGITITPGVMPNQLREDLAATVQRIGAKLIDTVRIDTTHFVCTEGRGQAWEKAQEMNVPVVVPDWVKGCEREGRIVGVRGYYLNADPALRQVGPSVNQSQTTLSAQQPSVDRRPSNLSQHSQLRVQPPLSSPRIEHTPPTPERTHPETDLPPTPPPKPRNSSALASAPMKTPDDEPETEAAPEVDPEPTAEPAPQAAPEVLPEAEPETAPEVTAPTEKTNEIPATPDSAEEPHSGDISPKTVGSSSTTSLVPETQQQPTENNLKAIGIPHGEADAPQPKEEEGGFDEVAL